MPTSLFRIDDESTLHPIAAEIMNPTGLALDDGGNLYISSRHDGAVYRLSTSGDLSTYAEGMGVATGLAFDELGNLYVGDRSGTIFKIAPDRQIFVFATLEPSVAAYHLAFSPNGNLYVTGPTTSSNDCVYEIDPHGVVTPFFTNLGRPQGLAFDLEGNFYVAASWRGHRGIIRITPEKQASLVIGGTNLVGLAFDPNHALILATNSAAYFLPWSIPGFTFNPEIPEPYVAVFLRATKRRTQNPGAPLPVLSSLTTSLPAAPHQRSSKHCAESPAVVLAIHRPAPAES